MANVFVVIGGWDYEGSDAESVKVFTNREAAEAYATELTTAGEGGYRRYDSAEVLERSAEGK